MTRQEPIAFERCSRVSELSDLPTMSWALQGNPSGQGASLVVRCRCDAVHVYQPESVKEGTLTLDCDACEMEETVRLRGWVT